jgi:hypothetical protein
MTSAQSSDYVSGSPQEITRAALDPATEPTSESGCTAAKGWPPAASTTPFVTPDLAYFHGLLEAIEDMHNQPDVGTLLAAVADYGMTIIPADGIAIIKRTAGGFRPVVIREVYEPDIVGGSRSSSWSPQKEGFSTSTALTTSARTGDGASSLFQAACEPGGRFSWLPRSVKPKPTHP